MMMQAEPSGDRHPPEARVGVGSGDSTATELVLARMSALVGTGQPPPLPSSHDFPPSSSSSPFRGAPQHPPHMRDDPFVRISSSSSSLRGGSGGRMEEDAALRRKESDGIDDHDDFDCAHRKISLTLAIGMMIAAVLVTAVLTLLIVRTSAKPVFVDRGGVTECAPCICPVLLVRNYTVVDNHEAVVVPSSAFNCTCSAADNSSVTLNAEMSHPTAVCQNHTVEVLSIITVNQTVNCSAQCPITISSTSTPPSPTPPSKQDGSQSSVPLTSNEKGILAHEVEEEFGKEWFTRPDPETGKFGVLVLYGYFETDTGRDNAAFFFAVGMQPWLNHPHVDFLMVMMSDISCEIPKANNIFRFNRRNFGMDVCAWNETLREDLIKSKTGKPLSQYRYIILMNASVRGPFIPNGRPASYWLPYFLGQITDKTKLVGTSINCVFHDFVDNTDDSDWKRVRYGWMHLQSMFLAFDYHALPLILQHVPCLHDFLDAVYNGEIKYTRAVLHAGYNVKSQMLPYRGVNWADKAEHEKACDYDWGRNGNAGGHSGDRGFPNEYYGMNYNPFEFVFVKTNRAVNMQQVNLYSQWILDYVNARYPYRPNCGVLLHPQNEKHYP